MNLRDGGKESRVGSFIGQGGEDEYFIKVAIESNEDLVHQDVYILKYLEKEDCDCLLKLKSYQTFAIDFNGKDKRHYPGLITNKVPGYDGESLSIANVLGMCKIGSPMFCDIENEFYNFAEQYINLNTKYHFLHNDLHFNNLLVDMENNTFVMVDYGNSYVKARSDAEGMILRKHIQSCFSNCECNSLTIDEWVNNHDIWYKKRMYSKFAPDVIEFLGVTWWRIAALIELGGLILVLCASNGFYKRQFVKKYGELVYKNLISTFKNHNNVKNSQMLYISLNPTPIVNAPFVIRDNTGSRIVDAAIDTVLYMFSKMHTPDNPITLFGSSQSDSMLHTNGVCYRQSFDVFLKLLTTEKIGGNIREFRPTKDYIDIGKLKHRRVYKCKGSRAKFVRYKGAYRTLTEIKRLLNI